jgi:hypothetical protein
MANNYPSKYSNGKTVSCAQYITELICENKAKKDGEDLHYRFWLSEKWEKFFKSQIASSHKLLKTYSDRAIIAAIKDIRSKSTYSLRSPFLLNIIKEHDKLIKAQNTDLKKEFDRAESPKFVSNNKKGLLSKLEEIDGI